MTFDFTRWHHVVVFRKLINELILQEGNTTKPTKPGISHFVLAGHAITLGAFSATMEEVTPTCTLNRRGGYSLQPSP